MKIWIDLDNSPHVHFFAPVIRYLEDHGVGVILTVRSFSQTVGLARSYGLDFTVVGEHRTPHSKVARVAATARRASQLAAHAWGQRPVAAISHGSRALTLAAWMLRVPSMALFDYEFISSGVFSRLSRRVMVPSLIPTSRVGNLNGKLLRYPGFKEEVYVYDFSPEATVLQDLNLDRRRMIIVVRPPATWAHYHDHHSEELFRALVERLRREREVQIVVLTRTGQQADELEHEYGMRDEPFVLVRRAVDGLSLMWYADAVFSGGGTMVREAALLGVDAYSTFAGTLGAADEALSREGKLRILRENSEIEALQLRKRTQSRQACRGDRTTRDFICEQILAFARSTEMRCRKLDGNSF